MEKTMDLSTFGPRLLLAAADFIEKHPNGADPLMKTLMAGACRNAAGPSKVAVVVAKKAPAPPADDTSVSDDNVEILLRAAGFKHIHKAPKAVYGFLLRHQTKAWDAGRICADTGMQRSVVNNTLAKLQRRGAIERVGAGQYRAR